MVAPIFLASSSILLVPDLEIGLKFMGFGAVGVNYGPETKYASLYGFKVKQNFMVPKPEPLRHVRPFGEPFSRTINRPKTDGIRKWNPKCI